MRYIYFIIYLSNSVNRVESRNPLANGLLSIFSLVICKKKFQTFKKDIKWKRKYHTVRTVPIFNQHSTGNLMKGDGLRFNFFFIITVLKSIEKFIDTKEVIRSLTSKDRQYTGQKDNQWAIKYYTENTGNTNPTKNEVNSDVLEG